MTTDPNNDQYEAADNELAHEEVDAPIQDAAPESDEPTDTAVDEEPAAARPSGPPIEPEAAAELAQEITLVTRALFAQMLPATSRNAIAGLPGHHTPASGFGVANTPATPTTEAPSPSAVPEPAPQQPAAPVTPEAPAAAAPSFAPEDVSTGSPQTPPGIAPPPLSVPGTAPGVTPGLAGPTPASEAPPAPAAQSDQPAAAGLPVPGLAVHGSAPPAPDTPAPSTPGAPSPGTPSIPVPGLGSVPPATDGDRDPDPADPADEPEQPTRPRPTPRRSLRVLDEVAFLDD